MRWLSTFTFSAILLSSVGLTHLAAADTPSVACDSLTARLSDDKNFYILDATASGSAGAITGYTFDYGDRESYRVTFSSKSTADRHAASVTHAYKTPGTYTVTVRINTKINGKSSSVSSGACKTSVTILPPDTTLPDTGANAVATITVSAAATLATALYHNLRLRRSYRR